MMRLSGLQRYILLQCLGSRRAHFLREELDQYYESAGHSPKSEDRQSSITKSLERLIDKGLLVGYGRRTPEKWFIDEIKLMPKGRRVAKKLLGEQQQLPLRLKKIQPPRP